MKKTKKLLACLIAAATMFTMGSTAFAATTVNTAEDHDSVTVGKVYKLTNADTTSPAETFTLEQVGNGEVKDGEATSAPALGTITGAEFAEGTATVDGVKETINVALPTYTNVGVYEYTLKEVAGKTAGVTYYGKEIKLTVTVVNGTDGNLRIAAVHTEAVGETKSDSFENTYSAGTLKISKTVAGNLGDKAKYFEFKVALKGAEGKTYANSYAVSGGSNTSNPKSIEIGKEATFLLKHGETISIANLPYGVTYTITETPAKGYETIKTGNTGTVDSAEQTAAFTNTKDGEIDTGINLTTLPYILVFAGVIVIAGAAFITRRRKYED